MPSRTPVKTVPQLVNHCFGKYDVSVYVGSNDRFRLAGDINRMQDVVDGTCRALITRAMDEDFTMFFAEVDQKVAECIRESGGAAEYDPEFGIDPTGTDPELVEVCFLRTYEYYRIQRPPLEQPR